MVQSNIIILFFTPLSLCFSKRNEFPINSFNDMISFFFPSICQSGSLPSLKKPQPIFTDLYRVVIF